MKDGKENRANGQLTAQERIARIKERRGQINERQEQIQQLEQKSSILRADAAELRTQAALYQLDNIKVRIAAGGENKRSR